MPHINALVCPHHSICKIDVGVHGTQQFMAVHKSHTPGTYVASIPPPPITVVSHKYAPPFATLASVQNVGGAFARGATISLVITPYLLVKHDLIVGVG